MSNELEMLKTLQPFMRKSKIYQEIFKAQSEQIHNREEAVVDLKKQLTIDTATWGLEVYERALAIPVDKQKPSTERAERIKAKLRGQGRVGIDLIKSTVGSWAGGTVDVIFENSTITITFVDLIGTPKNIEDVKIAVEEIKPAHLAVLYVFLYNIWSTVAEVDWQYLTDYTWKQVLEENIF